MKLSRKHRWLTPFLVAHLMGGAVPIVHAEEADHESFTFDEQAAPVGAAAGELSKANNLQKRSAPVSNAGAFGHSISIDVPPGRLGMTPSVALSYSSSAFRTEGEVGAGWKLGTRSITRSTQRGFPPVGASATGPVYDDAASVFEGPNGPMVVVADGPAAATGTIYAPLREHTPVRYEHISRYLGGLREDRWIEHDPSGVKRHYGSVSTFPDPGRPGLVANELGIHTWMLLEEVDSRGNNISYDYHLGTVSSDPAVPRQDPVLKSIRWGGNPSLSLPHPFELSVGVFPRTGSLDMLHGHVRNDLRVSAIGVRGPMTPPSNGPTDYWTYFLDYTTSADTGRMLLSSVTRWAPRFSGATSEQGQQWTFQYSGNSGVTRWDTAGADLPATMKGVYVDFSVNASSPSELPLSPEQKFDARSNPTDSRSATRLIDFDGNATLDAIYHAAGITRPDVKVIKEQSYVQTPQGAWQSLQSAPPAEVLDRSVTELADIDRDYDVDGIAFPSSTFNLDDADVIQPEPGDDWTSFEGFCTAVANSCCTQGLSCGDELPFIDCIDGSCPYLSGIEQYIYPADLVAQISLSAPLAVAAPGSAGAGAFCGAGPSLCNSYYNASVFEFCRTSSGACSSSDPLCAQFCNAPLTLLGESRQLAIIVNRNLARCNASTCDESELVTLNQWPATARQWTQTRYVTDPNHIQPEERYPEIVGNFYAPLVDANGDGLADIVLLKQSDSFLGPQSGKNTYLPRVYLSRTTPTHADFRLDTQVSTAQRFTSSLHNILANGVPEECYSRGDRLGFHPSCAGRTLPYPRDENFNTFLMDVNGDSLPDLIRARPPSGSGITTVCEPGHAVHLNTGYGFEESSTPLGQAWAALNSSASPTSHPFRLLRNRRAPVQDADGTDRDVRKVWSAAAVEPTIDARDGTSRRQR